eukprot:6874414-Karenia_brevis.AAC.1
MPEDEYLGFMCESHVNPPFDENDLKCFLDTRFPLEDHVDDFEMCLVINMEMEKIFKHLGGTPTPPGTTPSEEALVPHMLEMDPSGGKMEDD